MAQTRETLREAIDSLNTEIGTRLAFLKRNYIRYVIGFECLESVVDAAFNKYWSRDPPEIDDNDLKNFRNALLIINGQTGQPNTGTLERLYLLHEEYNAFPAIHNPIIDEMLEQFVECIEAKDTEKNTWIMIMENNRDQTMEAVQQGLPSPVALNGGKRRHKKGGKKSHKKKGGKKSHKKGGKKSHKKSHKRRH
jgi:hypothetical protein